jgi:hypothetical protein
MSLMKTGITPETFKRLLLDQGLVYVDYGLGGQRLIGVTRGGNKPEVNPEWRKMPFDGAAGDVKGDKRITGWGVKLTVNLCEASTNNLLMALPTFESAANGTHDVLTSDRQIADGDYYTNVTLVLQKTGTAQLWYFKMSNVLVTSPFSMDNKEKDEGVMAVEFTAHFAQNDLDTLPIEIGNPLETGSGFWTLTYTAGANGQILGNGSQIVADGGDGSPVYAAADSGYHFVEWTDTTTDNPRQDTSVSADITQQATFAAD